MAYVGVKPAGISSASQVDVTGDLTVDTNTLYVDSANNRVGVGTVAPATAIDVTGTVTSDGADLDGAVVINESGADADFRVESDGNANMLFVDAGQNNFGVGHGSPNRTMHISSPGAEMSLANTNMSTDRKTMNWFMSSDKAHWRMLNDAGTVGGGNVILDWDGNLTVSGNLDFNNDYAQAEASTTTNRTVVNTSGWLDHLSVTFTPRVSSTVFCYAHFAHGYESGPVNLVARFKIGASTYSNTFQIFKQGFGSNMAFGAHSMMDHFANIAASSQTVVLQVNNDGGSSTGIMNYFDSVGGGPAYGDYLQVFYR